MLRITFIALFSVVFFSSFSQTVVPYQWISGTWRGDGFGGTSEEIWSQPDENGVMMGSYRHFDADGNINFYEYFLLDSSGLVLKHFDKDFVGWEEKDEFVFFKMKEITDKKVNMEGMTYESISDSIMKIYVDIGTSEGVKTEVFTMRKQ